MPDPFEAISDVIAKIRSTQFTVTDVLRRGEGEVLGRIGCDPQECAYRVVSSGPFWRLREYVQPHAGPCLLIVAAPIKRPYIWDLAPAVSAVRHCLEHRLRVFLLEWMPASVETAPLGLKDYAGDAISACVVKIASEAQGVKPFLIGHSLGGTLAAIHCALAQDSLRGLVLLGAPLCFEPASSHFRDALVSIVPASFGNMEVIPGSLLSQVSALASPETFVWARLRDSALSIMDAAAWAVTVRVERWALDEMPLPGRLVGEIINLLYRENCFCHGTLRIDDRLIGPSSVKVPTLAIVNTADEIAPLGSIAPFLAAMPTKATRIIEYPGETGVGLQHLAVLIGREAHARLWPEIFSWLSALD
ncbi:MAG: alpha/beta fold hydrolase [Methylovirgula sp.]